MRRRRITAILTSAWVAVILASSGTPVSGAPSEGAAVMNEELMARLIKYTLGNTSVGAVTARICKVLDLCDGTADLPLKLSKSGSTDGLHYFGVRPQPDSKDIIVLVKRGTVVEAYLSDKTGKLRAAAVLENGIARLVTNERAAAKFNAELSLFAKEAAGLPPTGTSVASKPQPQSPK